MAELFPDEIKHLLPPHIESSELADVASNVVETLLSAPDLPASSLATSRLYDTVNDPDASLTEIAEVIEMDPGLAGQFLTLARSALYRGMDVETLEQAMVRIGMKEVRNFCLGSTMVRSIETYSESFDMEIFLSQTLLSARIVESVAKNIGYTGPAFLAGMLQNVGSIVLIALFGQEYRQVIRLAKQGDPIHIAEDAVYGINHQHVGALLCKNWGFKDDVITAVQYHHAPHELPEDHPALPLAYAQYLSFRLVATMYEDWANGYESTEECEASPEWKWLRARYVGGGEFIIDMEKEMETTQTMLNSLNMKPNFHGYHPIVE